MKKSNFRLMVFMIGMLVFVLACGTSASTPEPTVVPQSTTEVSSPATEVPPTEQPTIQHTDIPVNLPEKQSGKAGDFDSSKVLDSKGAVGGDRFTYDRFERPFNANTMDTYFPELDILSAESYQDGTWLYGSISLKELSQTSNEADKYAIELDVDINGKGDLLIVATKPESTDWTVNGVKVYADNNKDVGGEFPSLSDNAVSTGDGFETVIFDQGNGNDPDTAWVRISPNDPNTIEFAVKLSAIQNPQKYLINMWAGTSLLDPALFDFNDHFTHEQAGAADKGLANFYPIKEVSELDNTCRMAVGFQPTGKEPGLCDTYKPVQALDPSSPSSPSGCQASQSEIDSCNGDPSYSWNAASCSCVYVGPR